ncbi:hypothetical protein THTE_0797 [Thermogutta terrifontis]|uniref:Uncharacterized protein n=1 Tax=Thermogutta terrifontis TaxID=1331910 RepID=A0A286RBS1_9BACT|nr:hypothetical protein THTE_0797 [Thermogutta terrifontis]
MSCRASMSGLGWQLLKRKPLTGDTKEREKRLDQREFSMD